MDGRRSKPPCPERLPVSALTSVPVSEQPNSQKDPMAKLYQVFYQVCVNAPRTRRTAQIAIATGGLLFTQVGGNEQEGCQSSSLLDVPRGPLSRIRSTTSLVSPMHAVRCPTHLGRNWKLRSRCPVQYTSGPDQGDRNQDSVADDDASNSEEADDWDRSDARAEREMGKFNAWMHQSETDMSLSVRTISLGTPAIPNRPQYKALQGRRGENNLSKSITRDEALKPMEQINSHVDKCEDDEGKVTAPVVRNPGAPTDGHKI